MTDTSSYSYDSPLVYDNDQQYDPYFAVALPSINPPIPHLQLPLVVQADGTFGFWQQDTLETVTQCVEILCGTPQGQRTVVPQYGLPDLAFTQVNSRTIVNAIATYEPRAKVNISLTNSTASSITVTVGVTLNKGN